MEMRKDKGIDVVDASKIALDATLALTKDMQTDPNKVIKEPTIVTMEVEFLDDGGYKQFTQIGIGYEDKETAVYNRSLFKAILPSYIEKYEQNLILKNQQNLHSSMLMQNYSKRLGLDVSCFKFIFDGRRILEDETVKQLEMEDGDTINMMFNGSSMGLMTEPERKSREAKAKIQFKIHKDRQILLDPKENTSKKLSNSKSKPGDGRSQKEGHCFFLKAN